MATKSKKWHYYVMVFTSEGPKYVTKILPGHVAEWNINDKPMEFSAFWAEDLYRGLCLNFFTATLVKSLFEIDHHPYNYDSYNIKFEKKEEQENE